MGSHTRAYTHKNRPAFSNSLQRKHVLAQTQKPPAFQWICGSGCKQREFGREKCNLHAIFDRFRNIKASPTLKVEKPYFVNISYLFHLCKSLSIIISISNTLTDLTCSYIIWHSSFFHIFKQCAASAIKMPLNWFSTWTNIHIHTKFGIVTKNQCPLSTAFPFRI